MNEDFISFVWKHQLFSHKVLSTTEGESLEVLDPGILNYDSGPDYREARVKVGELVWSGAVELHVKASYWESHRHQVDPAYNNVVLHVVWNEDSIVRREDGSTIPTLELEKRVDASLLENYEVLRESIFDIPCSNSFKVIDNLVKGDMLDRVLAERLSRKANVNEIGLSKNLNDWEEQCFQSLTSYFGFRLNSESFSQLGRSLKYIYIARHRQRLFDIESILFGQSGWLEPHFDHEYHKSLRSNYDILRRKYQLDKGLVWTRWKFNRTRPANFPTLRIAQLAACLTTKRRLFDLFIYSNLEEIRDWLRAEVSEFWQNHYHFNKAISERHSNFLGRQSMDLLTINAIIPIRFAYAERMNNLTLRDSALDLLGKIKPEKNRIISKWNRIGMIAKDAGQSQGMIELFQSYCSKKKCLSCKIGFSIMRMN